MSRCALVTGASGGLGRTLATTLAEAGWQVRTTGRRDAAGLPDYRRADLIAGPPPDLLDGIDTIFHAAALSSPWGAADEFEAINVTAVAQLLAAARAAGVRRFVHVSTPSIYAEPRDRLHITEDDAPARRFANAYAASKWRGERLVLAADDPAMRTIAIRPRAIVGPDDSVLLPRLRAALARRTIALPAGGAALIELTDVRDVAAALIAAADAPGGGYAVNVSGGAPRPLRAIVQRVATSLGRTLQFVAVPRRAALFAGHLSELAGRVTGREPALTRYTAMTLGWSQTFDLTRAQARLGFAPRHSPGAAIDHALGQRCDA